MTDLVTLDLLEERWPAIRWREPIQVTVPGIGRALACRVCIAALGLSGREVGDLPQTREAWDEHFREAHLP